MAGRPPLRIGAHGKITRTQVAKGVWVARCRTRDLDGMTRRIERMTPAGVPDEYGARAGDALRDALASRRPPGTGTISGTTTLGELLTRYIERCRQDGDLAPKSVDTYAATLNKVRPRLADIRVSEATPGLLDEILRGIRRDHGATRERHAKVALNAVLTDAVLAGAIAANPVRELGRRRQRKADVKGAQRSPSTRCARCRKAIDTSDVCAAKDLRDAVVLLVATGLRRGELLALRWEDVDLTERVLTVAGSVVPVEGRRTRAAGHHHARRRVVCAFASVRGRRAAPTEG